MLKIASYLKFLFHSKPLSGHGIHSPFVYNLATEVLRKAKKNLPALKPVMEYRKLMLKSNEPITSSLWGAGGKNVNKALSIKQIARRAGSNTSKLAVLHELVKFHKPVCIVELGTSLGFSAMAMGLACPNSRLITIEGNPQLAQKAKTAIVENGLTMAEVVNAGFDEVLSGIVQEIKTPFLVFIDGNHSFEPTLKYYSAFAEKACSQSLVILDDVYWSDGMQRAWQQIKADTHNSLCIDLYSMALIYFRKGVEKQNFALGRGLF